MDSANWASVQDDVIQILYRYNKKMVALPSCADQTRNEILFSDVLCWDGMGSAPLGVRVKDVWRG